MKNLQFEINELPEGQMYYEKIELTAKEIGLKMENVNFVSPIDCSVRLIREKNIVYVSIDSSVDVQLECRRCLKLYKIQISTHFDYQYRPTDDPKKLESEFLDSIRTRYYMRESLSLADDVRQALTLEIPIWPLCSEDCKGLCPKCGTNLNESSCDCVIEVSQNGNLSRKFAGLYKLIENAKKENEV